MIESIAATQFYLELLMAEHLDETVEQITSEFDAEGAYRHYNCGSIALRPHLITEAGYQAITRAAIMVSRCLSIAVERLLMDAELRHFIGVPKYLNSILELDKECGQMSQFARFDGFVRNEAAVSFLEYNSEPQGLKILAGLTERFRNLPIARDFSHRYPFRSVSGGDIVTRALSYGRTPNGALGVRSIAVVGSDDTVDYESRWVLDDRLGCRVMLAAPEEFEIVSERVYVRGIEIDTILFSSWQPLLSRPQSCRALCAAINGGKVEVFNGLSRGLLSAYKHTFELLSDPQYHVMFPPEAIGALRQHIPWTRVVRDIVTTYGGRKVDLLRFITDHRERFVLKPSGGSGGRNVLLGWHTDGERWARSVRYAIGTHVVQERVIGQVGLYPVACAGAVDIIPLQSDLNPYVCNNSRVDGCISRLSKSELLNLTRGGMITTVWVLQ